MIGFIVKTTVRWWYTMPPDIAPAERRVYCQLLISAPIAWLIHFLYIFLFAYWNVPVLSKVNIFSVTLWTVSIILVRYNKLIFAFGVGAFEVILHSIFVIRYIGWGFGIQYYLITVMLGGFLMQWPKWVSIIFTLFLIGMFTLLYYYTQANIPLTIPNAVQLKVLNIINIFCAFILCGAIALFFITVAEKAEADPEVAHAKSETLLNNVLPAVIAGRLKRGESTIAENFDHASILFADIVDFTAFSRHIPPVKLVRLLNNMFSRFDELVDRHGLEKIKTIGDAYMVASGIPIPRDNHAEALACFALDMRDTMTDFNTDKSMHLRLRIGINSGPVVAGIIGKRRFLYDLWGEAVNTASRMESYGVPGEIQVTEATYHLLRHQFTFKERGIINIKGAGQMRTYFLRSRLCSDNNNYTL